MLLLRLLFLDRVVAGGHLLELFVLPAVLLVRVTVASPELCRLLLPSRHKIIKSLIKILVDLRRHISILPTLRAEEVLLF